MSIGTLPSGGMTIAGDLLGTGSTSSDPRIGYLTGVAGVAYVRDGSVLAIGQTDVATVGDIRLTTATARTLLSVRNNANNANIALIATDTGNAMSLRDGAIVIGGAGSLQFSAYARGTLITDGGGNVNSLANGTSGYVLVSNGPTAQPSWQLASTVGNPWPYLQVGTTPFAAAGLIRIGSPSVAGNRVVMSFRNNADNADAQILATDTANALLVGGTGATSIQLRANTAAQRAGISFNFPTDVNADANDVGTAAWINIRKPYTTGSVIAVRKADRTADINLLFMYADTNQFYIGDGTHLQAMALSSNGSIFFQPGGGAATVYMYAATTTFLNPLALTTSGSLTVAAAGLIRVPNNQPAVSARNFANTADLALVETDASNRLWLGITPTTTNQVSETWINGSSNVTLCANGTGYLQVLTGGVIGLINASYITFGTATVRQGSGTPEAAVTANPASLYLDYTNGAIYKKSTGTGNTGWTVLGGSSRPTVTVRTAAGPVTLVAEAYQAWANRLATPAAITYTLPTTGLTVGDVVVIADDAGDAAVNLITIDSGASGTIDGARYGYVATDWGAKTLLYVSTNRWKVIG